MDDPDISGAITACSFQYQLPANLVRAVCQVESGMNPWSIRYEPGWKYFCGDQLRMTLTERFTQMCSWGLGQVMGSVAREYGYAGPMPQLCEPDIGLTYTCKHLKHFYLAYDNWPDTIASYNAGSPRKLGTNLYVNQRYIDSVIKIWNALDAQEQI